MLEDANLLGKMESLRSHMKHVAAFLCLYYLHLGLV